ncbi:hypothetical protein D9619_010900 [Psilocybe cf. subviscida]|uniref:LIM zinc-binding domain-containing protein n=1 Tax=Psilocybe cf. subviscida TaxID=2480587 RepID=A0A8H5B852_9AGAR|nr:hypothetical protein D9619_010900 [Psilocybe cf. subviscida]
MYKGLQPPATAQATMASLVLKSPPLSQQRPTCTKCEKPVFLQTSSVVSCGDSLFHPRCFCCSTCNDTIAAGNEVRLLGNGRLICKQCLPMCTLCRFPITDDEFFLGNNAFYYHVACFSCTECKAPFQQQFMQKQSTALCMECHRAQRAEQETTKLVEEEEREYGGLSPLVLPKKKSRVSDKRRLSAHRL